MPANVKVSASWKTVSALYTRVGGSWKNVAEGYTKVGGAWKQFFSSNALVVDHLVIAGGGGGGSDQGGGGGAGGYRTSAGTSGGGAAAESRVSVAVATNYTVTVGAGGTGMSGTQTGGTSGSNSVFATITSTGGGKGGNGNADSALTGGSGGGGGAQLASQSGKSGTTNQGFAGANGSTPNAGGGGGAAEAGNTDGSREGGDGVASTITGSSVTYAGGGAGGSNNGSTVTGATGGGGNGTGNNTNGGAGTANTGGGGGGGGSTPGVGNGNGGNGGSGVVILSYPSTFDIRNGAGLTYTTSVVGSNKVTVFTAGTGNIQFASAANSSFVLLETVTLTSSQASVEFTNLNSKYAALGYQHLQVRMVGRTTRAVSEDGAPIMYFNSDTSSSYRSHYLVGTGSSVVSYDNGTNMGLGSYPGNSAGANQFLGSVIDILDPFETTKNKTIRVLAGLAGSFNSVRLNSAAWFSTSALTTITINANSGSWAAGTRISIYGLKGS